MSSLRKEQKQHHHLVINKQQQQNKNSNSNPLFDRKIEDIASGLISYYPNLLYKVASLNEENALTIINYIDAIRTETNLSDHYRMDLIRALSTFSIFFDNYKSFKQITRSDLLAFLDSFRKPEASDALHKWIGTYNIHRIHLTRFFKWLYYPDIEPDKRPKPQVIENIPQLKRKEQSIYKPTDLWTEQDDILFLKYCPSKRIKCYHAVSRDTSCRPHEILKLRIRDVVFKTTEDNKQYAEILVNGKTGSRPIPLFNSIPYIKDYLDHEHPMSGNPNSIFICGEGKSLGKSIRRGSLYQIYCKKFKQEYFPKLLDNPNVLPEDKAKIKELLKKPWNPYIRRHSALTDKAQILKEPILKMHAGWSPTSDMHLKYEHWFGNESSESLLEAYGIVTKDKQFADALRPKPCPDCNEPNKPDSKFCAKCRMVLTYDAYNETLEKQQEKDEEIRDIKEEIMALHESQKEILECLKYPDKLAAIARES